MQIRARISESGCNVLAPGLIVLILVIGSAPGVTGQSWEMYSHDFRHTCQSAVASQLPQNIRWQTPVDLDPQYSGGDLLTHYGSPLITSANTVLVPVKTAAGGSFRMEGHRGKNGSLLWTANSDYEFPHSNWIPSWSSTLLVKDTKVAMPAGGGTILVRNSPNSARGNLTRVAFFGIGNYNQDPAEWNAAVQICTPITSDASGNLYFGYVSTGVALPGFPNGLPSGLARIPHTGSGSYVTVDAMCGDATMVKVSYNCAPALTADGSSVYVAVNNVQVSNAGNFGNGYLCKLNSKSLARQAVVSLQDPRGYAASITDDSTASPTVGPDGDVYFGVLEGNFPSNHDRGWMLHFSGDLATTKTPGAFGWDDTASIVPSTAVPSYTGTSSYLILTKYNNYIEFGNGHEQGCDPRSQCHGGRSDHRHTVMNEVITILGPTPIPAVVTGSGASTRPRSTPSTSVHLSTARTVTSTDGTSLPTRSPPAFPMANATGEAYTPTVVGPDGAVYAINNAELYCCQANAGPDSEPRSRTPPGQLIRVIRGSSLQELPDEQPRRQALISAVGPIPPDRGRAIAGGDPRLLRVNIDGSGPDCRERRLLRV